MTVALAADPSRNIKCFISYRRDRPWQPEMIYRALTQHLGKENVFKDVDSISYGANFEAVLLSALRESDILFVIVDEYWLVDPEGRRKLDDPGDWVRREIQLALQLDIPIIPLLIDKVDLPSRDQLPDSIRDLTGYQAARIRAQDLDHDINRLVSDFRGRADANREAAAILEEINGPWKEGDWLGALDRLKTVQQRMRAANQVTYLSRALRRRSDTLLVLAQVVEALTSKRYEAARELLATIQQDEAPVNLPYARRIAECGLQVRTAIEAHDEPSLHRVRQDVALIRRECQAAELCAIPGLAELEAYLDGATIERTYREGYDAFRNGDLATAHERFTAAGEYRDAPRLLQAIGIWNTLFDKLREKKWDEARSMLAELGTVDAAERVEPWRLWTNVLKRVVVILDHMASGDFVDDPNVPWEGGTSPYKLLGIAPSTDQEAILNLAFDLQSRVAGLSTTDKSAWDGLRLSEKRLQADFGLYRIASTATAERLAEQLIGADHKNPPEAILARLRPPDPNSSAAERAAIRSPIVAIAEVLGSDGAVFSALLGNYRAAVDDCLEQAKADPSSFRALHHLALASAGSIYSDKGEPAELSEAWDTLLLALAAVIADDRFWHEWWVDRRAVYPASSGQVAIARAEIQRFWSEKIRATAASLPSLELALDVELEGAKAVMTGGGIPLPDGRHAVVGRLGARQLDISPAVLAWIGSFDPRCLESNGWQRRVCLYFSALSVPAAQLQLGRLDDVLSMPAPESVVIGSAFEIDNPGFAGLPDGRGLFRRAALQLQEEALQKIALAAISELPVKVEKAMDAWRQAIVKAEQRGSRAELQDTVCDAILGRVAFLMAKTGADQLDAYDSAITLLEDTMEASWDNGDRLKEALVAAYLDRCLHLANDFNDHENARHDAMRAWTLSPELLRAIHSLGASAVMFSRDKFCEGRHDQARALLQEAQATLSEGLRLYPGDPILTDWMATAEKQMRWLEGDGWIGELEDTVSKLPSMQPETRTPSSARLADAMVLEARGEFATAVELYWKLIEERPLDQDLRAKLAYCYQNWIFECYEQKASPVKMQEILMQALARCPGSTQLLALREQLAEDAKS